ncbi:hypothetical protein IKB17_00515 [bacterium]|nr:hypothetical protein [bacterium]
MKKIISLAIGLVFMFVLLGCNITSNENEKFEIPQDNFTFCPSQKSDMHNEELIIAYESYII